MRICLAVGGLVLGLLMTAQAGEVEPVPSLTVTWKQVNNDLKHNQRVAWNTTRQRFQTNYVAVLSSGELKADLKAWTLVRQTNRPPVLLPVEPKVPARFIRLRSVWQ